MSRELLCTLGPASLNERVIARLEGLGASLFRINLSHTKLEDVASAIRTIQAATKVPVCLDSEGAQVRTGALADGTISIRDNSLLRISRQPVPGDAREFNLYPADVVEKLEVGDFLTVDFHSVLLQVVAKDAGGADLRAINGGPIGKNKAVTVERDIPLPPLTEKDRKALALGRELGVRHVALSFAHRASDVDAVRAILGADAVVISKIECWAGLESLESIARKSNGLLIDRGDLSRQVPLERIPRVQKEIIARAKAVGVKVYVATNLLESMTAAPTPTRAEVNDVFNTLADGADGLVLAAETAIGAYPIHCAAMVAKIIREYESGASAARAAGPSDLGSLLVPPHGGRLVQREARAEDVEGLGGLPALRGRETDLMDCQQIAWGTYSPLEGFMDRATLESVLADCRLPGGTPWTMPVVLQASKDAARSIAPGRRARLEGPDGRTYAVIDVSEIFPVDFPRVAKAWFGTDSASHPGVARLAAGGDVFVAGAVTLVRRLDTPFKPYELSPAQSRFIFTHKGWSRVVGFHTRNVVHRVHEHIQLQALETSHADGLYISPVIGPKKAGDFLPAPVLKSYQLMLDFGLYPKGKVVLGSFSTYSRYAGPREAVFTALCRKNMGCSHFIIGRDHTGVGDFYKPEENQRLFERLGDLGIVPIFFDAIGYDPQSGSYGKINGGRYQSISGTQVREALRSSRPLPDWFMREPIQDMLRRDIAARQPVFFE